MTPEDKIVCLCTRQNFETGHQVKIMEICQSQPIQWDLVFDTAELHQVAPIVHRNLSKISSEHLRIPPAIVSRFAKSQYHNILTKKKTEYLLEEILEFFSRKGLQVMLVKGEAFSRLIYDQPWYTVSYDVDLVIRAGQGKIADDDLPEIKRFMEEISRRRTRFEEHIEYDFYEHHDVTMNNVVAVDWDRVWAEAGKLKIDRYEVFVMTLEDMLLSAAINSCRKRFFKLKSMFDMAVIFEMHPDINWDSVIGRAQAFKCNTILYTALIATEATLQCRVPAGVLNKLAVNPLRAAFIHTLVNHLSRRLSLADLFVRSNNATFKRTISWSLLLTYATYRVDQIGPKIRELISAWFNPPPEVPVQE